MKRYKCHKIVEAGVIKAITAAEIEVDGEFYWVDSDWIQKHAPKVGGYFVRYADGYTSYSPAEAFENGYTLLESDSALQEPADLKDRVAELDHALTKLSQELFDLQVGAKERQQDIALQTLENSSTGQAQEIVNLRGLIKGLEDRVYQLEIANRPDAEGTPV